MTDASGGGGSDGWWDHAAKATGTETDATQAEEIVQPPVEMETDPAPGLAPEPARQPLPVNTLVTLRQEIPTSGQSLFPGLQLRVLEDNGETLRVSIADSNTAALYSGPLPPILHQDVEVSEVAVAVTEAHAVLDGAARATAESLTSTINPSVQAHPLVYGSVGHTSGFQLGNEVSEALHNARGDEGAPPTEPGNPGVYVGQNTYAMLQGSRVLPDGSVDETHIRGLDRVSEEGHATPGPSYTPEALEREAIEKPTARDLREWQEREYVAKQSGRTAPAAVASGQVEPAQDGSKTRHYHAEDNILYSTTFESEMNAAMDEVAGLFEALEGERPTEPSKAKGPYTEEQAIKDVEILSIGIRQTITVIVSKYMCQTGTKKAGISGGCQSEVSEVMKRFWQKVRDRFGNERGYLMQALAPRMGPLDLELSVAGSYDRGPAVDNPLLREGAVLSMHMQVQFLKGGEAHVDWTNSSAVLATQMDAAYRESGFTLMAAQPPAPSAPPERERGDHTGWSLPVPPEASDRFFDKLLDLEVALDEAEEQAEAEKAARKKRRGDPPGTI